MKMPEGWKRLEERNRPYDFSDINKLLEISKEMAEALEKSINVIQYGGPFIVGDEIQALLKRFKEWK